MKTAVSVATLFASRQADSSPSVAIFPEKVVMKAVERAPSANRSRRQVWNTKGHQERVQIASGPEQSGKHLFADQAQDARAHHGDPDHASSARAYSFGAFRRHWRTQNIKSRVTKAKSFSGTL